MKRHIATRLTAAALAAAVLAACSPEPRGRGDIAGERLQEAVVSEREARYVAAVPDPAEPVAGQSQILFGDFHVHTTFSPDAFMWC